MSRDAQRRDLPPVKGGPAGCLNCGVAHDTLPMTAIVAVGFGDAHVERDGEVIFRENSHDARFARVRRFENMAARDPDHDWRIVLFGPLHGEAYQRQGPRRWVLVERNRGFA